MVYGSFSQRRPAAPAELLRGAPSPSAARLRPRCSSAVLLPPARTRWCKGRESYSRPRGSSGAARAAPPNRPSRPPHLHKYAGATGSSRSRALPQFEVQGSLRWRQKRLRLLGETAMPLSRGPGAGAVAAVARALQGGMR